MPRYTIQPERVIKHHIRALERRFLIAVSVLAVVVLISTAGFMVMGRHSGSFIERLVSSYWDTLNLISTVGSLTDLTVGQKVWGALVIMVGLGAAVYGFSTLQGLLHGEDITNYLERRKMKKELEGMQDHIVICGYGHVGRRVAACLSRENLEIVVIEKDTEVAREASDDGYMVVEGDATDGDGPLTQAGAGDAAGVIAALPDDAANVYVAMVARERNPAARIIARGEYESSRQWLKRGGAHDVVVPGESAAHQLASLLISPHLHEFYGQMSSHGEHGIVEIPLSKHPEAVGKTIGDLAIQRDHLGVVVSLRRSDGKHILNPAADLELGEDDSVLALLPDDGDRERPLV
jgi:voltage-gated potassium channel